MSVEMSNTERSILTYLSKRKEVTVEELSTLLSVDYQKTLMDLELLRKRGLIILGMENRYKPFRQVILASITGKGRSFLQKSPKASAKILNRSTDVASENKANDEQPLSTIVLRYPQYASIHRNIPIARRICESLVDSIYSGYSLEKVSNDQGNTIHSFFSKNDFAEIFRKIVEDTVIFGDSFFEITSTEPLMLSRIDPVLARFKHDWIEQDDDAAYTQSLESIITENGKELGKNKFVQFSHQVLQSTFGISAFGESFLTWQGLERAVNLIEIGNNERAILNRDYFEEQILYDGLPDTLLTKNVHLYSLPLSTKRGSSLHFTIQDRRRELERVVERKLFPIVLALEWDSMRWPKFIISGNLQLTD